VTMSGHAVRTVNLVEANDVEEKQAVNLNVNVTMRRGVHGVDEQNDEDQDIKTEDRVSDEKVNLNLNLKRRAHSKSMDKEQNERDGSVSVDQSVSTGSQLKGTPRGPVDSDCIETEEKGPSPRYKERRKESKEDNAKDEGQELCPVIDDDSSTEWTADEDDEHQGRLAMASLREQQEKVLKSKSATVPYPEGGPPMMANPFVDLTKKRRAALTKQNLQRHTQIETLKHTALKQREQQQQALFAQKQLISNSNGTANANIKLINGTPPHYKLKPTLQSSHSFQALALRSSPHHPNPGQLTPTHGALRTLNLEQHTVNGLNQLNGVQRRQSPPQYIPLQKHQPTHNPNALQSQSPLMFTNGIHTPPQNPIGVNGTNGMLWTQWDANNMSPRHRPGLTPQLSINSLPPMTTTNNNGTRTLSTQRLHGANTNNKHQAM